MRSIRVAKQHEVRPNQIKLVRAGPWEVALINLRGSIYAVQGRCTHAGQSLEEAFVSGDEVECTFHGSRFNIKDGHVVAPPATVPLRCFRVRVEGDDVLIELPDGEV